MGSGLFTVQTVTSNNGYEDGDPRDAEEALGIRYERDEITGKAKILRYEDLQHGDLLFPRGGDFESRIIETGCGSVYSHVGTILRVSPKFVASLVVFLNSLPSNWESRGFNSFQSDLNLCISLGTKIVHSNGAESQFVSEESVKINKDTIDESKRAGYSEWLEWFSAIQERTYGRTDAFYKHVSSLFAAYWYVRTNTIMMETLREECETTLDSEKELYYWESTTDDTMFCLIKGNRGPGVKLTKLKDRTCGYEGIMGVRRLVPSFHLGAIPDYRLMLTMMLCNMMLNRGKPYQEEYFDMVLALGYAKELIFCGSGLFCENCGESSQSGECCAYSCRPSVFADDYHFLSEYDSMYCTELAMELLLDYKIGIWFEEISNSTSPSLHHSDEERIVGIEVVRWVSPIYYPRRGDTNYDFGFSSSSPSDILSEGGKYFYGNLSGTATGGEGFPFYNSFGESVSFAVPFSSPQLFVPDRPIAYGHPEKQRFELQRRPISWLSAAFVLEIVLERFSNLNLPHGTRRRLSAGAPRTNVEVLYLTSFKEVPVGFELAEIKHYRRLELGLEKVNPNFFHYDQHYQ